MLELNKVYNMDCLEGIKQIDDNSIDSIITDPPYELGFMGKSWDNTGIANNVELWKEAYRILKPGGYLLSFGGTRTYHRMASAIEDAGLEVRDMINWCYGSGFPKSLNIGKAVDKLQGNKREHLGLNPNARDGGGNVQIIQKRKDDILTKGTSEWEGWGTALKPAHEPIVVARKPLLEKSVAENVLKHGTGGINIDESRVGIEIRKNNFNDFSNQHGNKFGNGEEIKKLGETETIGRFPANLIHDNSEEVKACFPNESSRFFKSCELTYEDITSLYYCAKASKGERNKGCEDLEEKIGGGMNGTQNQTLLTGSGNIRNNLMTNNHPTVKPIKLMEYLVKLVTRKDGIVLDPFIGSGTTAVACAKNGYEFIGFEKEKEYIEIINARLKPYIAQTRLFKEE